MQKNVNMKIQEITKPVKVEVVKITPKEKGLRVGVGLLEGHEDKFNTLYLYDLFTSPKHEDLRNNLRVGQRLLIQNGSITSEDFAKGHASCIQTTDLTIYS